MADPGFPRGGAPTMKLKEFGSPLRSATGRGVRGVYRVRCGVAPDTRICECGVRDSLGFYCAVTIERFRYTLHRGFLREV